MNKTPWKWSLLLPALFTLGACGSHPAAIENFGVIEVHNSAEAAVTAWSYRLCGQSQVYPVVLAGAEGTIPQNFFASIEEYGGTCTDHTFRLANDRTIVFNNIVVVAQSTVTLTLVPPEAGTGS